MWRNIAFVYETLLFKEETVVEIKCFEHYNDQNIKKKEQLKVADYLEDFGAINQNQSS